MVIWPLKIVSPENRGVVERLGQFKGIREPGLHFMIPFLDDLELIDMRETVIDVPPQPVITKDNVTVEVDAVIYYWVVDPQRVVYEVANFRLAITKLAQTSLRNLIGDMALDESLTSRDLINTQLRTILDEATDKWGVKVNRVELQKIDPPRDIQEAMSRQMKAERDKRATILEAEAYKQKQILEAEGDRDNMIKRAEGERQSAINVAEGDKQAAILRAEGQEKAIQMVADAAQAHFKGDAQIWRQLEVLNEILIDNTKYVIPSDSQVINVLGLDSMLKQKPK
jgi:regulator of protease activity HflC (stomatin/prohibitin superfamily)